MAAQQVSMAHPPGLPMPATDQQQLQHHVRQLLQEVSSSDHLSSSDNDEHKTSTEMQQVQMTNPQQYDKQRSPMLHLSTVSPKGKGACNSSVCKTP